MDDTTAPVATDLATERIGRTVGLLFELVGRMRHHFESVAAELELSPPQARALRTLSQPCAMRDIATSLHCDASNVTGIVDRLEERGLAARTSDPQDRRRRTIVLTEDGAALRDALRDRLVRDRPGIAGLDPDELETFHDLLVRCLASFES